MRRDDRRKGDNVKSSSGRARVTSDSAPAGACGLYCGVCSAFIATRDDPDRLAVLAQRRGLTVDDMRCEGCRSKKLSSYCKTCRLVACATERGHEFCSACPDFPCDELRAFGRERPHRAEIMDDLERIREIGRDAWVVEVLARYTCEECGVENSAYDLRCRICGHVPGNAFVADHRAEIEEALRGPSVDK